MWNFIYSEKRLLVLTLLVFTVLLASCGGTGVSKRPYGTLDNKPKVWTQYNWKIRKFAKGYASKRSTHVERSLKRAQPYLPFILRTLKRHKLPPELAYLPILESRFEINAVSRTGARGMWQFVKGTARHYGLTVNWARDERTDWRKSTVAAVRYLKVLGKRFNYNWELALAGYNGGGGYVSRAMKSQHTWNFWKLRLRKETMEYVPKFLAILHVARTKYPRYFKK